MRWLGALGHGLTRFLYLPCFLGKTKENHPKRQGFCLSAERLDALEIRGKTLQKARDFLATKKTRKSKKTRKGRSGQGSFPESIKDFSDLAKRNNSKRNIKETKTPKKGWVRV